MIRITFYDGESTAMQVNVDLERPGGNPPDAEIMSLASAILASDAVQNSPQWTATPALYSLTVDELKTLYPTP